MIRFVTLILIILSIFACAGGSAGTGIGSSSTVEGRILNQGLPVQNANVTILETGDSDSTDSNGVFAIQVSDEQEEYTLEVNYEQTIQTVKVPASSQGSIVNVEIDVSNNPAIPLDVKSLEVQAKIVGVCDAYFENKRVIRQSNKAPQGIECTAKVVTSSNSEPVGGVRFAVQHKPCEDNAEWQLEAASETSQKFSPGIGQVQFKFYDDPKHCLYRIITPYETQGVKAVEVLIETFTAQDLGY